jgi:hypothetical protein
MKKITRKNIIYTAKLFVSLSVLVLLQIIQNYFLTGADGQSLCFPPAIIIGLLSLATAGVGYAQQAKGVNAPKTQCEQDCVNVCKAEHKALFSGRQKCIKACKADCAVVNNAPPPQDQGTNINWWYVGGGALLLVALLLIIFRKQLSRKK